MHTHSIDRWQHDHVFLGEKHELYERRTWLVVALTVATMIAEIVGGTIYHSMALVADGWHMATHAGALAIAALAYRFARRHDRDARFSFGTGKLGELAAFASAVILGLIALLIAYESLQRLFSPVTIQFEQAILIAVIGLAVNLGSAWLLYDKQHHVEHSHPHGDASDHNIRAAYLHVLADATTSVLAIVALVAGSIWGWVWLDPMMGLIGALLITHWSIGMMRSAGAILLDMVPDLELDRLIRARLELKGDRVSDLHIWRLGPGHTGLVAAIVSDRPRPPAAYKARLAGISGLSHITIEVHPCGGADPERMPT